MNSIADTAEKGKMERMDISRALFDLSVKATGIASVAAAIHAAMEKGPYSTEAYMQAIWLVSVLVEEHAAKLAALDESVLPSKGAKK